MPFTNHGCCVDCCRIHTAGCCNTFLWNPTGTLKKNGSVLGCFFRLKHYMSNWLVHVLMQTLAVAVHSAQQNELNRAMSAWPMGPKRGAPISLLITNSQYIKVASQSQSWRQKQPSRNSPFPSCIARENFFFYVIGEIRLFSPGLAWTKHYCSFSAVTHNNKTTVQIMVHWQKWLTCRVPLQKAHSTCALRKFLSETLVWPDLSARGNKNSARSRSWKWPLPFLLVFFLFFMILPRGICSCPSPQGGQRSECRVRYKAMPM